MTTVDWLHESLMIHETTHALVPEPLHRLGKDWTPIVGFGSMGYIFAIYKDTSADKRYCVHLGEEWLDNQEPLLGYYNGDLSWNDLITEIAKNMMIFAQINT
jgi:hypothetical protein